MRFDLAPEKPRTDPAAAHQPTVHPTPAAATAAPHPTPNPTPGQSPSPTPSPTPGQTPTPTPIQTPTPSPSASVSPDSRSTTFQAVEGGGETRSGETLLVSAYAILWVILMGWLVLLWRKQGALNARLDDLDHAINRALERTETTEKTTRADKTAKAEKRAEAQAEKRG